MRIILLFAAIIGIYFTTFAKDFQISKIEAQRLIGGDDVPAEDNETISWLPTAACTSVP